MEASIAHIPKGASPVMDVVPPRQSAAPESTAMNSSQPTLPVHEPASDAAPDLSPDPKMDKPESPAKPAADAPKAKKPATERAGGGGVALAIVATVIIVLGVAALFVYAYLKAENPSFTPF